MAESGLSYLCDKFELTERDRRELDEYQSGLGTNESMSNQNDLLMRIHYVQKELSEIAGLAAAMGGRGKIACKHMTDAITQTVSGQRHIEAQRKVESERTDPFDLL